MGGGNGMPRGLGWVGSVGGWVVVVEKKKKERKKEKGILFLPVDDFFFFSFLHLPVIGSYSID